MAMEIIDATNYRDKFGSRVEPGEYVLAVEEIEQGQTSKEPKRPMWTIYYRVVGGDFDGSTIIDRITISDKTMFLVAGFLSAFGVNVQGKRIQFDPQRLVGRKVIATLGDGEPFRGTVRSEVTGYSKFASVTTASAAPADIDDLDDEPAADAPEAAQEVAEEAPETTDAVDVDIDDLDSIEV